MSTDDDFFHDPTNPKMAITIVKIPITTEEAANPTSIS